MQGIGSVLDVATMTINLISCYQITDFGLSKIRATSSNQTTRQSGSSFAPAGTVPYISPERYDSHDDVITPLHVQAMSDVYK